MCGIATILKQPTAEIPPATIQRMIKEVRHRGPDNEGSLFLNCIPGGGWQPSCTPPSRWTVALGHRRLSILDLTSTGHQPMVYRDKLWIVYNGEVYNFVELRAELERLDHTFRSSSDTEVILAAYAQWGPASFTRLRGMWGLVIIDCIRNEAVLCRDRIGIKPLYMWQGPGMVVVASEIKQFRHLPGFTAYMDPLAAAEYLRTGYEDPERSFFRDIRPVPAGTWLHIPLDTLQPSPARGYWYPERVQVVVTDAEEAGRLFAEKLRECVHIHLRSDVPVGCALSGGLDSSSIAVLVHALQDGDEGPLHTFTSTFPGDATDEREYADTVLKEIYAEPHFVTPDPTKFLEDLDRFLWIHDEPVGGISVYAAYCIARLTRQVGIPVTLNGQGGDEILSGYWQSYYLYLHRLVRQGRFLSLASHFAGALLGTGNPVLVSQAPVMFRRYRARSNPLTQVRLRKNLVRNAIGVVNGVLALDEPTRRVHEIRTMHLPRLLKWDDRNSMAFSVEGRYPFLDHELIELSLSFASRTLYSRGWTKWPLRLGLRDVLPSKILHRRTKFGFEVPQDKWLCGPLRPKLERWLERDCPAWDYVEREGVRRLADQTWRLNGKRDEPGQALFRIFVFDRWLKLFDVVG